MAFLETMAKLIERYNSFFTEGIVNTLIIAAFSVPVSYTHLTLPTTERV